MSYMDATGSSPDTVDTGHGKSPNASVSEQSAAHRKPGKRDRVALACQRCKTRKQKCDGQRPACASCARLSLKCVYIVPLVPAAGEKKIYIRALEQRVAELESYLASLGHMGTGTDHLGRPAQASSSHQHAIASGNQSGQPISQGQQTSDDDDDNDILVAVRDLSLSASGHYVGASSNITIGRVLSSVVHSQRAANPFVYDEQVAQGDDDPAPKSVYSTSQGDVMGVPFLSPSVATRLLQGWFRHIATRYPVIHSARLMELHNNRDSLTDDFGRAILHIIYAVSGRWLESAGEMGHFFSDQHYDLAFAHMDSILRLRDSRAVDYLLLMALYCTRAPRDPGAWTYVGAAMKLCIELGLHRRPRRPQLSVEGEMNKRRFWTAYFLDRDVSIAIGRPPCISDHDIDAELPFDINEDTLDIEIIRQASMRVGNAPLNPPTTLTSFIHRTRLKLIESEIQHVIYRVDRPNKVPDTTINMFIDRLSAWQDAIPYDARNYVHRQDVAYDGLEFYTIHYHRCVRFLLFPQLAEIPLNMRYLRLCSDASAGIITDYRRLHTVFPVGFSALSIQSVFLAGLTLIYCAWLAPVNFLSVEGPLTDCQLLLYIVTERYPSARKYRDVFERIRSSILSMIAQGKHQPRNPVRIEPNIQDDFPTPPAQWGNGAGDEYNYMITTMTGNAATSQFDLGIDPATIDLVGRHAGQSVTGMGQFQTAWPGMTSQGMSQGMSQDMPQDMPQDMNDMGAMGGMFR
ncbi:Uu.00g041450.m01.CDS01 [Anthostomella pinea]|uniref:Uu.00g041450.m01.CDS01 n=1 Tax=Anthostomella pinea TaxID=933095 RepID=A0AAI8VAX0_9PEZI|nr:Uu.00g041450.m01.CDS01 [Anthostomella pinea]